ncbi:MAG: ATP-binding protein [Anaerolineaceae bacterium]|nr:ATP-binding protein [Anaerolineaceae bacterium]
MWYRKLSSGLPADQELQGTIRDVFQDIARNLIVLIGVIYLIVQLIIVASNPAEYIAPFAPLSALMFGGAALSLWLLPQRFWLAQAAWQGSILGAVILASITFHTPEAAFLVVLLPFIGMVTAGWQMATVSAILVSIVGLCFTILGLTPPSYALAVLFGSLLTLLIGWTTTTSLLTVTQWAFYSYQQGRKHVEDARQQRVEYHEIQEDLLHSNRELVRLTQRLKVLTQEAEEARRVKEEFVANISHELRTPLNMIIGFCEMISQSPQVYGRQLPALLMADIAAIQRNSLQLSDLVNDVLDLSMVESGRMALNKEWIVLQKIVAEAVEAVRPMFQSKGLYLDVNLLDEPMPVLGDPTRIREVVLNLLSNAGRFTSEGGVRIGMMRQANEVVVSISDTGPGIAPSDQSRLFQPFEQLDPSIRRQHGGSGLGLVISRQFVELHGGRMWLASQVEVGTTFFFSLPLEARFPQEPAGTNVGRWFNPYQNYTERTRPWRLVPPEITTRYVVVEGESRLAPLLRRYLDNAEIIVVADMAAAFTELERSPAQALIVNQPQPPVVVDVTGRLPFETPLVTCWAPGTASAEHHLGVVRYLVKPVERQRLLEALDDLGDKVHTVVLADDHPEAQQLFTRMLASASRKYVVYHAINGHQAIELLRARKPDVLLLDLIMPDLDGFGVLKAKSQDATIRDIPVIVISATDPSNTLMITDALTVKRSGGLSAADFMTCLQALSTALMPQHPKGGPGAVTDQPD